MQQESGTHLDLQNVITPDPLVMHLMIGVVRIMTILILDERKACVTSAQAVGCLGRTALTAYSKQSEGQGCRSGQDDHS